MKNFEEALNRTEGNLKHEGIFLIKEEKEIIKEWVEKEITKEEFQNKLMELHTRKHNEILAAVEKINNDTDREVFYEEQEERIIMPEK